MSYKLKTKQTNNNALPFIGVILLFLLFTIFISTVLEWAVKLGIDIGGLL